MKGEVNFQKTFFYGLLKEDDIEDNCVTHCVGAMFIAALE